MRTAPSRVTGSVCTGTTAVLRTTVSLHACLDHGDFIKATHITFELYYVFTQPHIFCPHPFSAASELSRDL